VSDEMQNWRSIEMISTSAALAVGADAGDNQNRTETSVYRIRDVQRLCR